MNTYDVLYEKRAEYRCDIDQHLYVVVIAENEQDAIQIADNEVFLVKKYKDFKFKEIWLSEYQNTYGVIYIDEVF